MTADAIDGVPWLITFRRYNAGPIGVFQKSLLLGSRTKFLFRVSACHFPSFVDFVIKEKYSSNAIDFNDYFSNICDDFSTSLDNRSRKSVTPWALFALWRSIFLIWKIIFILIMINIAHKIFIKSLSLLLLQKCQNKFKRSLNHKNLYLDYKN